MGTRKLIIVVAGIHVCVLVLAGLFGGCASGKKAVKLTTASPVKDIKVPETAPEPMLEPKGMVEETDLLVSEKPESILSKPVDSARVTGAAGGEEAAKIDLDQKEKEIDAALDKKEVSAAKPEKAAVPAAPRSEEKPAPALAAAPERVGPVIPAIKRASEGKEAAQKEKQGAGATYRVVSGDSLWKLSQKYGVSRAEIAKANNLQPDSGLRAGQVLTIPGGVISPMSAAPSAPGRETAAVSGKKHKVRRGETVSLIAKRYRVSAKKLIEVNKIKDPGKIRVGDVLVIPE